MPPTMRLRESSEMHKKCHSEIKEVFIRYRNELTIKEMLALSAHLTGVLIAMQDQKTMTVEAALAMVAENIELGNADAMRNIQIPQGTA